MADDNEDELEPGSETPEQFKALRKKAREADTTKAELAALRREMAFTKAGIDTATKLGAMFARSFDGDVADIEAIKAEAKEIGVPLLGSPTPSNIEGGAPEVTEGEPGEPNPDAGQAAERRALATNALPDDGQGVDPRKAASDTATEIINRGGTDEDGIAAFIAALAEPAAKGDPRVLVRGRFDH